MAFINSNEDGTLLPTEHNLASLYAVSRPTVRQALNELETEGLIRREKGRGTYILKANINVEKIYRNTTRDTIYVPMSRTYKKVILDNKKVGISLFTHKSSYFNILRDSITSELGKYGIRELLADANDDVEKQIAQLYSFVNEKVDLIIVDPVSPPSALNPILDRAYNFNIPVISVNSHLDAESKHLAYIGCDNYELGVRTGIFVGSALKNKYGMMKGKIAIIEGDPGNIAGAERGEGFLAGLKRIGNLKRVEIIDRRCGYWSIEGGVSAGRAILTSHPKLDFIYAYSDSMALGAIKTASEMRRTEVLFSSIDGSRAALQNIVEGGPLASIGLNDPVRIAQIAAAFSVSFLSTGIIPSRIILTEPIIITQENVNAFYDARSPF